MQKALFISILLLVVFVGLAADRTPDTASELYPLASAIGWVSGEGRDLKPDLTGTGIQPPHTVKIGTAIVPRTPPVVMLHYGTISRIFSEITGRKIDGSDLPLLSWWVNFTGIIPWAMLLFYGLYMLALRWGKGDSLNRVWGAWAGIFGSLAAGWLGTFSPWLIVSALAIWVVVLIFKGSTDLKPVNLGLAGLLGGLSGAAHPSGWIWVAAGIFYLFVLMADREIRQKIPRGIVMFMAGAIFGIALSMAGNFLFFGTVLPVQMAGQTPLPAGPVGLLVLGWHDLIGWNGVLWLSPLVLTGIIALFKWRSDMERSGLTVMLIGIAAIILAVWAIADDAGYQAELAKVNPGLAVVPIELTDGHLSIVSVEPPQGTDADRRAYYEMMIQRTDIFLWNGGRPVGLPVFIPAACLLSLLGWCRFAGRTRFSAWNWIAVRLGGFLAIIASQAPWGAISHYYLYVGMIPDQTGMPFYGHAPIVEALLSVSIKLNELWPTGVVRF